MSSSKSSAKTWLTLIIIGLLCLNIYQWYANTNLKSSISENKKELLVLEKAQAELDNEYQDALSRIEGLRDENKNMSDMIDNQKIELKNQRDKINDLIWSKRELSSAREEMKSLNALAAQYVDQLNAMKNENKRLAASNIQLSKEKEVITLDLVEEKKVTTELTEAKTALVTEKAALEEKKEILDAQVEMASVIKINWLEVQGMQTKGDGKVKQKKKAKDVNVLRVCYKTESNYVTKAGYENFQVRYINPLGETQAVEDLGSGILFDKFTNREVRYSMEGGIDYNNKDAEGCIDWEINFPLMKGEYEVELYNKGYLCGKGQFKLK